MWDNVSEILRILHLFSDRVVGILMVPHLFSDRVAGTLRISHSFSDRVAEILGRSDAKKIHPIKLWDSLNEATHYSLYPLHPP